MYKVFINDRVIFFTKDTNIYQHLENVLVIHFFDKATARFAYELLCSETKTKYVIFKTNTPNIDFKSFVACFELIIAAGGRVNNSDGNTLFIYRLGKWDLPKGKLEENESLKQGAIREVEEECGISGLTIEKHLMDTYHMYELNERVVIKQSVWFLMNTKDCSELIPQKEENITDARWMTSDEIKEIVLNNTYPSIKEIFDSIY
ncbi:MAG: NUDIX domain-containing protein [Vicingaceae bacterium]|nr:NUDIX domain-containing protein [Vicingaceae bacterium]